MIVTCPACSTRFRVDEAALPEGGAARGRCSRCQHVFELRRPEEEPQEESFFSPEEEGGEFGPADRRSGSFAARFLNWKRVAAVLAAAAVAGGLIYYLTGPGQMQTRDARRFFSSAVDFVNAKAADMKDLSSWISSLRKFFGIGDSKEGFISVEKVKGFYVENNEQKRLFVIEGEAVNHWKESRSLLKVKAALLDTRGARVKEKEAYCGNILSEKDLKEMSLASIEKSLSSQFGISFSNLNILPNKGVPFMVVFPDLAADRLPGTPGEAAPKLSDFTVEITGSQKGTK